MDWFQGPDVERILGEVSGQWIVKGTRILVDGVIDNSDDNTPEEIATELFPGLGIDRAGASSPMPASMRLLLDHNVPVPLARFLSCHRSKHALQRITSRCIYSIWRSAITCSFLLID